MTAEKSLFSVKVLFDFEPELENELQVRVDDIVQVTWSSEESGWCLGVMQDGKTGCVARGLHSVAYF